MFESQFLCFRIETASIFIPRGPTESDDIYMIMEFLKKGSYWKTVALNQIPPNYMANSTKILQIFGEPKRKYINYPMID